MSKFKVGVNVYWTSQANARTKRKHGTIVAIVPAGCAPEHSIPDGLRRVSSYGFGRNHDSYIVAVQGTAYWPRVSALRRVEEQP